MKQYVIIGGGIAGINCVEGIRSLDREGSITLLSGEPISNYGRPLISYYLQGKTDLSRMSYRGKNFYEKNDITALHGVSAEEIIPDSREVLASDGQRIPYDELCLCTGSVPFVPPMKGLDTVENCFSFLTLEDARAIEKVLTPESRVLIVGGGLIGLKAAEGIHGRVRSITVCDLADHVLSSILQPDSAVIVERHLTENGISLRLGKTVERFEGSAAFLTGGERIDFDLLILAVGVRPNGALLEKSCGKTVRGAIVTDSFQRTDFPHIYAAGDCTGPYLILPSAAMQGLCAGKNMAGGSETLSSNIPLNSIGFFGLHMMTAGSCPEGCETREEKGEGFLKRLFLKDNRLRGFLLMGDKALSRAGIYTALIREERPLDTLDMEAMITDPGLLPFSPKYRSQKLGGVV